MQSRGFYTIIKRKSDTQALPDLVACYEQAACGLVTTALDGTILTANSTFCDWLGFSLEELLQAKKIQDLLTVGSRFFHQTHWAPLMQLQGAVSEVQLDLRNAQGKVLPMFVNASRKTLHSQQYDQLAFMIATDRKSYERELISARKSVEESLQSLHIAQQQLQQSNEFFSVAIRSARMGVWSHDLATKRITWSRELQQLTGLSDSKVWEQVDDFYDLIHPEDRQIFISELQKALENETDYYIVFRLKHSSGGWLTMEARGHATYADSGEAISVFGIFSDISERRETERQLKELNQKLTLADKLKDEFLATLGHELRNPLAPIQNVLEIMRLKQPEYPELQWFSDVLGRHIGQMTHLVDDLLEASRISQGRLALRKQKVDIADIVTNAVEATQTMMQQCEHQLTVQKPNSSIIIDADATRLIQVLSNLLKNAAKYTPTGGKILLQAYQSNNQVVLSVKDSGIGIPQDQLSNVFNMFSQLTPAIERAEGGLGIGLALASDLVRMHGGHIYASSSGEGKGSQFTVHLPLTDDQTAPRPETSLEPAKPLHIPKRILVIDDSIDAAESLALLLDLVGHTTQLAHDGSSAIEAAKTFRPDIILSDIGLPDINGYELAKQIRQLNWGQTVLMIATTGWGQDKDIALAKAAGFDKHFTKPVNFQELKAYLMAQDQTEP